jgi:O-antigen/teichoic acid export membrane protein
MTISAVVSLAAAIAPIIVAAQTADVETVARLSLLATVVGSMMVACSLGLRELSSIDRAGRFLAAEFFLVRAGSSLAAALAAIAIVVASPIMAGRPMLAVTLAAAGATDAVADQAFGFCLRDRAAGRILASQLLRFGLATGAALLGISLLGSDTAYGWMRLSASLAVLVAFDLRGEPLRRSIRVGGSGGRLPRRAAVVDLVRVGARLGGAAALLIITGMVPRALLSLQLEPAGFASVSTYYSVVAGGAAVAGSVGAVLVAEVGAEGGEPERQRRWRQCAALSFGVPLLFLAGGLALANDLFVLLFGARFLPVRSEQLALLAIGGLSCLVSLRTAMLVGFGEAGKVLRATTAGCAACLLGCLAAFLAGSPAATIAAWLLAYGTMGLGVLLLGRVTTSETAAVQARKPSVAPGGAGRPPLLGTCHER